MEETFWQKDSLITHILFELWLIMIFSPVANFAQQSLTSQNRQKYYYQWRYAFGKYNQNLMLHTRTYAGKCMGGNDDYVSPQKYLVHTK